MTMSQYGLRGAIFCLALALTLQAWAQGPTLPRDIFGKRDLTNEDRAAIAAYVAYWTRALSSDPNAPDAYSQINSAGRALGPSIFKTLDLSPFFRVAYSETIVPELKRLIDGADVHAACRAMYLAGRLGTDAGLNLLIDQIDSAEVLRRNAAARSARLSVQDFREGASRSMVTPAILATLERKAERAGTAETSPFALQRQAELLDAIYNAAVARSEVLPDLAAAAQDARLAVLAAQASDVAGDEADALTMMIATLRTHYQIETARQRADGPELAGALNSILATCLAHWDTARANPARNQSYRRLIEDAENFLVFIDSTLRTSASPPKTKLKQSWENNDKQQFQKDREQWNGILQMEPYKKGG